jgi:hypothetical protein
MEGREEDTMSSLNIVNGPKVHPGQIVKLFPGQKPLALENARTDGAVEIFLKAGNDTYVASGPKGLASKASLRPGMQVAIGGQVTEVEAVFDETTKDMTPKGASWLTSGIAAGIGGLMALLGLEGMTASIYPAMGTFTRAAALSDRSWGPTRLLVGLLIVAGALLLGKSLEVPDLERKAMIKAKGKMASHGRTVG